MGNKLFTEPQKPKYDQLVSKSNKDVKYMHILDKMESMESYGSNIKGKIYKHLGIPDELSLEDVRESKSFISELENLREVKKPENITFESVDKISRLRNECSIMSLEDDLESMVNLVKLYQYKFGMEGYYIPIEEDIAESLDLSFEDFVMTLDLMYGKMVDCLESNYCKISEEKNSDIDRELSKYNYSATEVSDGIHEIIMESLSIPQSDNMRSLTNELHSLEFITESIVNYGKEVSDYSGSSFEIDKVPTGVNKEHSYPIISLSTEICNKLMKVEFDISGDSRVDVSFEGLKSERDITSSITHTNELINSFSNKVKLLKHSEGNKIVDVSENNSSKINDRENVSENYVYLSVSRFIKETRQELLSELLIHGKRHLDKLNSSSNFSMEGHTELGDEQTNISSFNSLIREVNSLKKSLVDVGYVLNENRLTLELDHIMTGLPSGSYIEHADNVFKSINLAKELSLEEFAHSVSKRERIFLSDVLSETCSKLQTSESIPKITNHSVSVGGVEEFNFTDIGNEDFYVTIDKSAKTCTKFKFVYSRSGNPTLTEENVGDMASYFSNEDMIVELYDEVKRRTKINKETIELFRKELDDPTSPYNDDEMAMAMNIVNEVNGSLISKLPNLMDGLYSPVIKVLQAAARVSG